MLLLATDSELPATLTEPPCPAPSVLAVIREPPSRVIGPSLRTTHRPGLSSPSDPLKIDAPAVRTMRIAGADLGAVAGAAAGGDARRADLAAGHGEAAGLHGHRAAAAGGDSRRS